MLANIFVAVRAILIKMRKHCAMQFVCPSAYSRVQEGGELPNTKSICRCRLHRHALNLKLECLGVVLIRDLFDRMRTPIVLGHQELQICLNLSVAFDFFESIRLLKSAQPLVLCWFPFNCLYLHSLSATAIRLLQRVDV